MTDVTSPIKRRILYHGLYTNRSRWTTDTYTVNRISEGIIAHATYKISSGKIEGINQKIKTLRRHGYGYPDDEYFFLKIMDMSRKEYVRNQPSHKICN